MNHAVAGIIITILMLAGLVFGLWLRHRHFERYWTRQNGFLIGGNPSIDLMHYLPVMYRFAVERTGTEFNFGIDVKDDLGYHAQAHLEGKNWTGTAKLVRKFPLFSEGWHVARVEALDDKALVVYELCQRIIPKLRGAGGWNRNKELKSAYDMEDKLRVKVGLPRKYG